jgi:tetratricopeptide (TPR) repeat protein
MQGIPLQPRVAPTAIEAGRLADRSPKREVITMFRSHKLTALLAIFALAVLAPSAAAQQQSPQMQKIVEAEQLIKQGNPDGALAIVGELLEENPEFAFAYFIAGLAYEAKENAGAAGDTKTEYCQNAYDNFLKAAEYQPGYGIAHRLASMHAADRGDLDASWQQAIKAHQSGTDMNDAFTGLGTMSEKPADLEQQLAVKRVFVAPMDTETFENQGDRSLGSSTSTRNIRENSASSNADVGRRVLNEAAADIAQFQREANRQFASSRAFGLVQRPEMADLIMVFEVDSISDDTRRRTRGFMKLLDAKSGEEAFRRRVEFADIATRAELNRDFSQIMSIIEEWAAENLR